MSDFDFDDDDQFGSDTGSDLVKQLRKQLREISRERDELKTQNAEYALSSRKATLADILQSKKINPKLATFLTKDDVEATDEAVSKWLEEYGEVFNIRPSEEPADPAQSSDPASAAPAAQQEDPNVAAFRQAMEAMQSSEVASTPAAPPSSAALQALLAKAGDVKSADEFFRAIGAGG